MTSVVSNAAAKSDVWVHFGFPGSADGSVVTKRRVVCRICKQDMPYKNNTTNLYSHLERHHKDEHAKLRKTGTALKEAQQPSKGAQQPSISATFANVTPLGSSTARHKQLVDAIGMFVIKDMRPLSIVEGEGFCQLMKAADSFQAS